MPFVAFICFAFLSRNKSVWIGVVIRCAIEERHYPSHRMSREDDEEDTEEEHCESGHCALLCCCCCFDSGALRIKVVLCCFFAILCCLSGVCFDIIILEISINIYYNCDNIEHIYSIHFIRE